MLLLFLSPRRISTTSTSPLLLALGLLFLSSTSVVVADHDESGIHAYKATIKPFANDTATDTNVVAGQVVVFSITDAVVSYGGFITGLESNLQELDAACTAEPNGCGVHIHAGTTCATPEEALGHYYDADVVSEDPWTEIRYSSNENGATEFSGLAKIGTDDLDGRAFVVHRADGSRLGCGLLEPVNDDMLLVTETTDLTMADTTTATSTPVESQVAIVPIPGTDQLCLVGRASGLEANIIAASSSVARQTTTDGGDTSDNAQCTATNGCGIHIHSGTSCADTASQGGHYYNNNTLTSDPWQNVIYEETDENGNAFYTECLSTGFSSDDAYVNRAFIVHAEDGSRLSCGILMAAAPTNEEEGSSGATAATARTQLMALGLGLMMALFAWIIV